MAEPDGIQDAPEKTATVTRKRRHLCESLPVEEEEALTRVIEKNKIGKEVLDGGNGGKPVLPGPLRADARRESRAVAKKDLL
jgi:hypothetical protein